MELIVGLDMSKNSAAMALYLIRAKSWRAFAFAQRQKEESFVYRQPNIKVELLPRVPKTECDLKVYHHTSHHLMKVLNRFITEHHIQRDKVAIFIEDYVHLPRGSKFGSNHGHKLHENCGIFKYVLFTNGLKNMFIVNNKTWKAKVVANGNASKKDVVDHIAKNEPCVDMLKILKLKISASGIVPNPAQDLADACAIVKYGIVQYPDGGVNALMKSDLDSGEELLSEEEFSRGDNSGDVDESEDAD